MVSNREAADILDELAEVLDLQGANAYRVRAYRNAARTIEDLDERLADMVKAGRDLTELPGIGEAIASKLEEIVATGNLQELTKQRTATPATLSGLLRVEGLGPRKVQLLWEGLGVRDLSSLEDAARNGRLATLKGFGPQSERQILAAISRMGKVTERRIRPHVEARVRRLMQALAKAEGVERIEAAGSLRRRRDTIGDVDLVAAGAGDALFETLRSHPAVAQVIASGPTKMSVRLDTGLQVDLRLVAPASFGAALLYFTGSKQHNIRLRRRALERKFKLNEYGLFRGKRCIAGRTEAEVYDALGLETVPPELREDHGEIELAAKKALPKLIGLKDIKGDLHTHTDATDGRSPLTAMAEAARKRGHSYMAVTDHTQRTSIAGGMKPDGFKVQAKAINRLNARFESEGEKFRLLKGAEVDILKDGRLDLPDDVLAGLDVVVCSLHFREKQSGREHTERVLKAMSSPHADILAHPTGRLIGRRPQMDIDWARLADAAQDQGWAFEVDGDPMRQDLPDDLVRLAHAKGVMFSLDSDAHATHELGFQENAVMQARRGWLEAKDVVNAKSLADLRKWLDKRG